MGKKKGSYGLWYGNDLIPLKFARIAIEMLDLTAVVNIQQMFVIQNEGKEKKSLEFAFPIDDTQGSVISSKIYVDDCYFGGTQVKTKEEEKKEKAQNKRNRRGKTKNKSQRDKFQVNFGTSCVEEKVVIEMKYVIELKSVFETRSIYFNVPYIFSESYDENSLVTIETEMEMSSKILMINSPYSEQWKLSHEPNSTSASIHLSIPKLEKDFSFSVSIEKFYDPRAWLIEDKDNNYCASLLVLNPQFSVQTHSEQKFEIIFIVDRSGFFSLLLLSFFFFFFF